MKIILSKTMAGLVPADPNTSDWYSKLKPGETVRGEFKKIRNYAFLQKFFVLLTVAYDNWASGEINSKYGTPLKNFNRFRADVTILAGFYDVTVRLDGSTRIEPKSISFAKMEAEEFSTLYSAVIDVLLKHVYGKDMDAKQLNEIVERYLSFA